MSLAWCQINPIDVNFHLQKSLEIFEKQSADKVQSKKDKGLKPIRVRTRNANSMAIFIPQGFGNGGMAICHSSMIGKTKTYSPEKRLGNSWNGFLGFPRFPGFPVASLVRAYLVTTVADNNWTIDNHFDWNSCWCCIMISFSCTPEKRNQRW